MSFDTFKKLCLNGGTLTEIKKFIRSNIYKVHIFTSFACQTDRLDVIKFLVLTFNINVHRSFFLSHACFVGNLEIVMFLVEHNADVNHNFPILEAIHKKHTSVVKYLLEKGTNDPEFLLSAAKSNLEILRCVMDKYKPCDMKRLLRIACEYGVLENVEYLISKGENIDPMCLRIAVANGHLDVVMCLVRAGSKIETSLLCHNKHYEIVKYLVSMGGDRSVISSQAEKYLKFCEKMQPKIREKAQKKIYFWWIPICYDITHPSGCGKRMMQKNWEATQQLMATTEI